MTDPATGSKFVIVNTSAGERQLQKLAPADWVRIGNIMRADRKAERRAELVAEIAAEAAGDAPDLTPAKRQEMADERAKRLKAGMDEFDRRPVRYRDVEAYVNTPAGQYAAILLSLQKTDPKAGEIEFNALELEPDAWLGVTAELLNLKVVTSPLPAGGGENPPPSGTGTGEPTPTPSATT